MGDPRRIRKKYHTPSHPWQADRIQEEKKLLAEYGLKNKREIWKALAILRGIRGQARELLGKRGEQAKRQEELLIARLHRLNLLKEGSSLDDVLGLTVKDILERRLQTLVYKKGLAFTMKQARQFIVHGHISVAGRKVTSPSYLVRATEEDAISYVENSPVRNIQVVRKEEAKEEAA
ncbi:30S ribosomal protein S4 [Candidatus Pyrohabitans sp.]